MIPWKSVLRNYVQNNEYFEIIRMGLSIMQPHRTNTRILTWVEAFLSRVNDYQHPMEQK